MLNLEAISSAVSSGCQPRDVRPIDEWAGDNVWLPLGGSAQPGRFTARTARHVVDVLADLRNPLVRQVNILKPTQGVGTTTVEVWLLWLLSNEPGPTQVNFNTEALQERNWLNRLKPMMKSCASLRHLLPDDERKFRKDGVILNNGIPFVTQSATTGNLQADSIRYQANDEIWDWDEGMFREADARLDAFRRVGMSKQANISQAGIEGGDWHRICFGRGVAFSEWEVPCIHCGVYQVLKMEKAEKDGTRYLMQWDDNGGNVRYECPSCGKHMVDSDKLKAHFNMEGRYTPVPDGSTHRTRRWNALSWSRWDDLVKEYREALDAKKMGVLIPLKSFILKRLVEFWREDESVPIVKPEFYDIETAIKPERSVRFLTIDTQTDHFWACVREWEADGSSRLLHWSRVLSWSELIEIQKRYGILSAEWKALRAWDRNRRQGTRPAIVSHVFIDTGGDRTQEVYDACWNYGWVGLKGSDKESYLHRQTDRAGTTRESTHLIAQQNDLLNYESKGSFLPLWLWATTGAKDILANLRDGKGRAWKVPANIGDAYLRGINAEVKEAVGAGKWRWRQIGSRPNHAWDCEAMQVLAASEAGIFKL